MGSMIFLLCLLFVLTRAQLVLKLHAVFDPENAFDFVSRHQIETSRKVFLLARFCKGITHVTEPIEGLDLPEVFVIVANHQSLGDIPGTLIAFPKRRIRFVAKRELKWGVPYISSVARVGKHALISRSGDYRQGYKELRRLADMTRRGICPLVFPEGTRSRDGSVGKFHAGAVRAILERAPVPVLSIAIDGGYKVSKLSAIMGDLRGETYRVKHLKLHPAPHGKTEIMELISEMEKEIREQIQKWRQKEAEGRTGTKNHVRAI
jgi:1-acyl-sn-glycerol-3-phosphate acyltransferase